MNKLYYTPPPKDIFDEVKNAAMEIWQTYDDTYGYASEKIDRIKDLENISDNFMHIVAMFDLNNQVTLAGKLSVEANKAIVDRVLAGGGKASPFMIPIMFNKDAL